MATMFAADTAKTESRGYGCAQSSRGKQEILQAYSVLLIRSILFGLSFPLSIDAKHKGWVRYSR